MFSIIHTFEGPLAVLNIPKCGTQTLKFLSFKTDEIGNHQNYKARIAFVRHPLERIKSAYRHCCTIRGGIPKEILYKYEKFVDFTFDSTDQHWRPQVEFIREVMAPNLTGIYPLSRMGQVLKPYLGRVPKKVNESDSIFKTSSYREDDLREKYFEDIELYNGIS